MEGLGEKIYQREEKAGLWLFRERGPFGALKAEKGRGEGLK